MQEDSVPVWLDLQSLVDATVERIRAAGTDLQSVEAKQGVGGLPRSALESVCAFANAGGGLLLLGLSDSDFRPVEIDAPKLAADLASACSSELEPSIRPGIDIARVEGRSVVVARVEALEHQRRPCYIRARGMERGTFLRTHDGDRRLNSYEVHIMVSGRGQPEDDTAVVPDAGLDDLDPRLTGALLQRLRETRGPVFGRAGDEEVLHMMGVLAEPAAGSAVRLAGLLALGRYPQQFFPQLAASFVALPTVSGEPMADGTRFLDNQPLDGPIPMIVSGALDAMRRNMRRRAVIVGAGREDVWDYPVEAIREIVTNALMHRDYHPSAHGSPVRISLYPDRFEVSSVGGLHGPNAGMTDVGELIGRGVIATRNARLARLLEDVVGPGTGRPVCENRGSGLRATVAALRRADLPPPRFTDSVSELRVTIFGADAGREHLLPRRPWPARSAAHITGGSMSSTIGPSVSALQPRERQIVELLSDGPRSSSEIARALGISQQAVLRWLNRMAGNDLIRATELVRRNRRNRWELNPDP